MSKHTSWLLNTEWNSVFLVNDLSTFHTFIVNSIWDQLGKHVCSLLVLWNQHFSYLLFLLSLSVCCQDTSKCEQMISILGWKKHTLTDIPMFLNKDTLASILRIHVINVEKPIRGRHQQARELLNPDTTYTRHEEPIHKRTSRPKHTSISCSLPYIARAQMFFRPNMLSRTVAKALSWCIISDTCAGK